MKRLRSLFYPLQATREDMVRLSACTLHMHVYQPDEEDDQEEFSAADPNAEDEEKVMAATVMGLPSASLDGVWDR